MKPAILFFICLLIISASFSHPLKMAYTSVKYNQEKEVFEIGHRVFQDDFEQVLKRFYGYAGGDVVIKQEENACRKAVIAFFEKNFSVFFNDEEAETFFLRMEQKRDVGIIVWFESRKINPESISNIRVFNSIMMESFKEQVNMFHINIKDTFKRTIKFEWDFRKETLVVKD